VRPRASDVVRRLLVGGGFVFSFLLVVILVMPRYGWLFSLFVLFVVTIMLVRAYSMGYRYKCANCGTVFKVPLAVDFLTFSGMGKNPDGTYHTWKSLTCPSCGQRTRAVAVRVESVDQSEIVEQRGLPARNADRGDRAGGGSSGGQRGAQRGGGRKRG